jgi:hypothetical protein
VHRAGLLRRRLHCNRAATAQRLPSRCSQCVASSSPVAPRDAALPTPALGGVPAPLLLAQPAPQNSRHHRRAARQLQCLQRPGARKPNRGAGPQGGFCGASIPAALTPSRAAPRRNRRCARCCPAITSPAICAMCRPTCSRKPRPYRRKCLEPFPDSSEKTRLGARKSLLLFKKIFKLKTYRRFG